MHRLILALFTGFCFASTGFAAGDTQLYLQANEFAENGKFDFAYMHFNKLLRDYPASKHRSKALFATGEYYFQTSDWGKAQSAFQALLNEYPDSKNRIYALAYLYKLADKNNDHLTFEGLAKEIIDLHSVSLVFRDSKETTYKSPLAFQYKTVIHIDKIEFYLEGEFFAKVVL